MAVRKEDAGSGFVRILTENLKCFRFLTGRVWIAAGLRPSQ